MTITSMSGAPSPEVLSSITCLYSDGGKRFGSSERTKAAASPSCDNVDCYGEKNVYVRGHTFDENGPVPMNWYCKKLLQNLNVAHALSAAK